MTAIAHTLIALAQRQAATGLQLSQAINQAQAALALETVLEPERLASPAGTAASFATLDQLEALMQLHKQTFDRFALASSTEFAAALDGVAEAERDGYRQGVMAAAQWQLDAQAAFFQIRARWIAAARGLCELFERRRAHIAFGEDGFEFADEADLERFLALAAVIDETHRQEVALLEERMARHARAAATLAGATPS